MNISDKKIIILGSQGLLGKRLSNYFRFLGYKLFLPSRETLEKNKKKEILELIITQNIKTVINLIANTNVDNCEKFPLYAYQSNVKTLEGLVDIFLKTGVHLIHISTDQVYSGNGPHSEKNTDPCNVYGITKYLSEKIALEVDATILRTNFSGKSLSKNRYSFSDWIVNSIKNQKQITLYEDIFFSPLSLTDLCRYIEIVVKSKNRGIYNLGSKNSISKAEFGKQLVKNLGIGSNLISISNSKKANFKAKRPLDMSLNIRKFEREFNLDLPTIHETNISISNDYNDCN